MIVDALIVLLLISVPITYILARTYLKTKELQGKIPQASLLLSPTAELNPTLQQLQETLNRLTERVQNLEAIITEVGDGPGRISDSHSLPTMPQATSGPNPASYTSTPTTQS